MVFIKSTKTLSQMLAQRFWNTEGTGSSVGTSLKATNTAQAQTGQLQISVTFSDEYRKLKEMLVDSSTILFRAPLLGRNRNGRREPAIRQPLIRLGRFVGQGKRGIGIALSLPQRDFRSVRRFGDFKFPRCAQTARGH